MKQDIIILAPHADDEIIGCYEVLATGRVSHVCFPTPAGFSEAYVSSQMFGFTPISMHEGKQRISADPSLIILAPDHNHDYHPEHRRLGQWAEFTLIREGYNVYLYNVRMNAPYIREVKSPEKKLQALNQAYPEKRALWEFDHRFWLFEGQTKWMMSWRD